VIGDVNVWAILVAAVAVFAMGAVWNTAFATQLAALHPAYAETSAEARPPAWKLALELLRGLLVASVVAGLAELIEVADWVDGVQLGAALWVGFPLVLLTGAVVWEKVPPKLAAIHSGDWLLKLLVIGFIVSVWR
jgi:hypothetical protein